MDLSEEMSYDNVDLVTLAPSVFTRRHRLVALATSESAVRSEDVSTSSSGP